MGRTYIGTKKICGYGNTALLYIDKNWQFKKGDVVEISMYHIDHPKKVYNLTKKVCALGDSVGIFCDTSCGFKKGDMVVFSVTKKGEIICDTARSEDKEAD